MVLDKEHLRTLLPHGSTRMFGCTHCPWKYNVRCGPFRAMESDDYNTIIFPDAGICEDRVDWLLGFLPDYDVEPSYDQLMFDLGKGLHQSQVLQLFDHIQDHDRRIKELERDDPGNEEGLRVLRRLKRDFEKSYKELNRELLKYNNLALDREHKDSKDHPMLNKPTPTQVTELIEGAKQRISQEKEVLDIDSIPSRSDQAKD